jgi:ABC-2 type transport system ATP-binding protein
VSVNGVTKRYGSLAAVAQATLAIHPGEVYALLGLNGAGKTTLIRMLLGMVRPTCGTLGLAGRPVTDRSVWAEVGYLVETPSAYPDLTVRENLDIARRLRRLPSRTVVDEAVDRFGLGPYAASKARTLSLGNAQRLGLAKALMHHPRILVLDEPVNGLDPAGVVEVRTMLTDLARDDGVTVLLSSHLLGEVARVATRIGILHQGRLIEELDSTTLEASTRTRLEVGSRDIARAAETLRAAGFEVHQGAVDTLVLMGRAVHHPEEVATALVEGGEPPTRLAVVDEDLEGHFMRLVGHHADAPGGIR